MSQTLRGLKVVELAQFISGPYCAVLLAALGAEVVKIEKPNVGDQSRQSGPFPNDIPQPERSGLFRYLNRNKRGITLNIETATGREILLRLLKEADVFIEDMPVKLARRFKLNYPSLSKINPRLIVVSITPFGQTGPYRNYKAYAINSSAMGGMSLTVGEPGREPLTPPFSLGDYQAGIIAANAIMFALLARDMIGEGQHIDVSQVEAWAVFHTGNVVSAYIYRQQKRIRAGHRTPAPYPYTILPCKDGYVFMIALRGAQWKRFLEIVGNGKVPDWYANDERFRDRRRAGLEYADDLDKLLAPWLMSHTKEEIFALCRQRHVPFAPVRNIDEVVNDEHLNQRDYFTEIEFNGGNEKFKYPGAPFRFSQSRWDLSQPAPSLGQYNYQVYCKQLGYSTEKLARLHRMNII
jgi:crotonobetainyl-CoA:carnitine CoA-transferase CaiB-like acyl-CoA transferase